MEEIFRSKVGSEFTLEDLSAETSIDGEGDLFDVDAIEEVDPVHEARVIREIQAEVSEFITNQIDNGEEPDYDLVMHMDELLNEG
jgi:hypothetical protein